MTHELLPLHRLDCGTEGIVVLGKHAQFAKTFGKLMRDSSSAGEQQACFQKTYLALTSAPAEVGVLKHHALTNVRSKGLPAYTRLVPAPCKGSIECVLEVLQVGTEASVVWQCCTATSIVPDLLHPNRK